MSANTSGGSLPEEFFHSVSPIVRNLHLVSVLILTAAVLILNAMVIFIAWKNRRADPDAMTNAAALATLDIAWTTLVNPITFYALASKSWPFGQTFCDVTGSLTFGVILLRNQLVGLSVADKFCNVFAPFSYPPHRRRVLATLAVAATFFAIAYPIPPALTRSTGRYTFYTAYAACFLDLSCVEAGCDGYLAVIGTHWVVCWAILPAVLFTAMCVKARTMTNSETVMGTFAADPTASRKPGLRSNPSYVDPAVCSNAPKFASPGPSLSDRDSNKGQTTFVLHMVIYIGCFLPLAIHFATYRTGFNGSPPNSELSATLGFICGDVGLLLAVLDPLVTLTNRNARDSVLSNFWALLIDRS